MQAISKLQGFSKSDAWDTLCSGFPCRYILVTLLDGSLSDNLNVTVSGIVNDALAELESHSFSAAASVQDPVVISRLALEGKRADSFKSFAASSGARAKQDGSRPHKCEDLVARVSAVVQAWIPGQVPDPCTWPHHDASGIAKQCLDVLRNQVDVGQDLACQRKVAIELQVEAFCRIPCRRDHIFDEDRCLACVFGPASSSEPDVRLRASG